jgi:hypothetical protein
MRTVAGADEAEQTPQVADRTRQIANETRPTDQALQGAEPSSVPARPEAAQAQADTEQPSQKPGFGERGRMRRRARFLRKARELAYRDLGGLVFDLHRFGQRNDPLVLAKLAMLRRLDTELRELEQVLHDRRPVTVLREVGIAACPRCAALHGSDDRFCPGCGIAFDANADRPISTAPMTPQTQVPASNAQSPTATPTPAPPQATGSASMTTPAPPQDAGPASATTPSPPVRPSPSQATPSAPPVRPTAPQATPPAPPVKPIAAPVPAKQTSPSPSRPTSSPPASPGRDEPRPAQEDEPTQILRPPGADR